MREVWTRMESEQKALLDTRDGMTKLMAKGTTELWRLKQRMECLLKGFEKKIYDACGEENKSRAKHEEEARSRDRSKEAARRRPLANREDPRSPNVERAGRHSREARRQLWGVQGAGHQDVPQGQGACRSLPRARRQVCHRLRGQQVRRAGGRQS